MPSGDEKIRLLPVVSTILKLSPAEMEQIQKSINGKTKQKKVSFPIIIIIWSKMAQHGLEESSEVEGF